MRSLFPFDFLLILYIFHFPSSGNLFTKKTRLFNNQSKGDSLFNNFSIKTLYAHYNPSNISKVLFVDYISKSKNLFQPPNCILLFICHIPWDTHITYFIKFLMYQFSVYLKANIALEYSVTISCRNV